MDRDVAKFILDILEAYEFAPRGAAQIAHLADLHSRAVAQVQAATSPGEDAQ